MLVLRQFQKLLPPEANFQMRWECVWALFSKIDLSRGENAEEGIPTGRIQAALCGV